MQYGTGLSHRTSFGKITSEGRRPNASKRPSVRTNVRVGRSPADGTSGRPVGRPSDGMPSATPSGERHGGRPYDRQSPAPTVGWMADGHAVRRSGWRSAAGGQLGGPLRLGRPPGAVLQKPSARVRPPSRNFGGP
jgi:hypothetical protein